jgi:hypothetical protein
VLHSGHANSPYNALVQVLDVYFRIRRIHMKPGAIRDYGHSHPPRRGFKCPTVQARYWKGGSLELAEMQKPVIAETNQISCFETNDDFRLRPIEWTEIRSTERGCKKSSSPPLVLPLLEKGIYGAKVGNLDS